MQTNWALKGIHNIWRGRTYLFQVKDPRYVKRINNRKQQKIINQKKKIKYTPGGIPFIPTSTVLPFIPAVPSVLDYLQAKTRLENLSKTIPIEDPWTAPDAKELDKISLHTWEKQVNK